MATNAASDVSRHVFEQLLEIGVTHARHRRQVYFGFSPEEVAACCPPRECVGWALESLPVSVGSEYWLTVRPCSQEVILGQ